MVHFIYISNTIYEHGNINHKNCDVNFFQYREVLSHTGSSSFRFEIQSMGFLSTTVHLPTAQWDDNQ